MAASRAGVTRSPYCGAHLGRADPGGCLADPGGELGGEPRPPPPRPSGRVEQARTKAEPTITPSAKPATSAAWAPVRTPSPTPTGRSVCARIRATSAAAPAPTVVPGAGDAHRRGRVDEAAAGRARSARSARRWSDGATRKTRSRPCASAAAIQSAPASSGMRSGVISPAPPAAARSRANASHAVALDRVPVGHDQHRHARPRRPPRPSRSTSADPDAAGQRALRRPRWITGPSISGSE